MTRIALCLALLVASAPALAEGAWSQAKSDVGPAPWVEVATSAAFGPDDAYLFAEPAPSPRLDQDAETAASLVDRERMADRPVAPWPDKTGRIAVAFSDFVSYGPDGLAYASAALARAGGGAVRVAVATPSMATFALALR